MRIRPDGLELLRAARIVVDATIKPYVPDNRRDTLHAIENAITLAEDRLTREAEASSADLAALADARAAMRGIVLTSLPEERHYDARLVAKAISVAAQQLANGALVERREYERLAALLDAPSEADADLSEVRCALPSLNQELVRRIRAAEADLGTMKYTATLAYLEATTDEALSESNPTYRRRVSVLAQPSAGAIVTTSPTNRRTDMAPASQGAVSEAITTAPALGKTVAPFACIDGWLQLCGVVGEAVYAPGNAALTAQANFVGWFTQRLAANPRVPMAVVEGAHQAHDFSVALADANAVLLKLVLAPLRRLEPLPVDATRSR